MEKIIQAKYPGFCSTCYFTIWKGEYILFSGKAKHKDCQAALSDRTPRKLNPSYRTQNGFSITKEEMKLSLKPKQQPKEKEEVVPEVILSVRDVKKVITTSNINKVCCYCRRPFEEKGKFKREQFKKGLGIHSWCKNRLNSKGKNPNQVEKSPYTNYTYLKAGQRRR